MNGQSENGTQPANGHVRKASTGIPGLDEITAGGLPEGRPTLVCGCAGSGKTVLAISAAVYGAEHLGEPAAIFTFEETVRELEQNMASLGVDLPRHVREGRLAIQHVLIDRSEIEETGEYDLEGLFVRLEHAISSIGARRVVLDTIEAVFSGFSNEAVLRAELRRLFRWLKERGLTAIVTAERGVDTLTRHGLEEYLSDCVILLDHRVEEEYSTRRIQIVKYRGSAHGTNEYPFLIDGGGIAVMPVTSLGLDHPVSSEQVSTGIPRLDSMLGGNGFYRGTSVLISGTAGTGKSSIAASCAAASCARGERCLYLAFEESPGQIMRNMRSIGIDLLPWMERGLLRFHASRPTLFGLEAHLAAIHRLVEEFEPALVILDPITNFISTSSPGQVRSMLMRLIDFLKMRQVTGVFTSLTDSAAAEQQSEAGVSSLIDTWLLLKFIETNGERNRGLYVLKSRGMAHSNQVREFVLTEHGIEIVDVYVGPSGVLTGSARYAQEARERAQARNLEYEMERTRRELERLREERRRQAATMEASFDAREEELMKAILQGQERVDIVHADRETVARLRRSDDAAGNGGQA